MTIVILSKMATNLVPCVTSIFANETAPRIVVVDDGARKDTPPEIASRLEWVDGAKPFVFARNANLGIAAADDDVILLNDDTRLLTPGGFTKLAEIGQRYGLTSAVFTDCVGNLAQLRRGTDGVRFEKEGCIAFICVFISKRTQERIGALDERFVTYGWDDNDYCKRVRDAGMPLAIYDGCLVEHGKLPSTFRGFGAGDISAGREIYWQKWGVAQ